MSVSKGSQEAMSTPFYRAADETQPMITPEVEHAWERAMEGVCSYCRWKSSQAHHFNRWFETHEHIDDKHPEAPYQKLPVYYDPELALEIE